LFIENKIPYNHLRCSLFDDGRYMQDAGQKDAYQPLNPGDKPPTCVRNYSAGKWDIEDYRAGLG
jgi:hypothetical protein